MVQRDGKRKEKKKRSRSEIYTSYTPITPTTIVLRVLPCCVASTINYCCLTRKCFLRTARARYIYEARAGYLVFIRGIPCVGVDFFIIHFGIPQATTAMYLSRRLWNSPSTGNSLWGVYSSRCRRFTDTRGETCTCSSTRHFLKTPPMVGARAGSCR